MNIILLIFFAIPLAVIIFSIALQKILKCPPLVAGIIFAIGIIVTFILGNTIFLVATVIYTLISYIVAIITCLITKYFCNANIDNTCIKKCCNQNIRNTNNNNLLTISSNCENTNNGDLLRINSTCANGNTNNLLTISSDCRRNTCNCNNSTNNMNCCNNGDNETNTINGIIRISDNRSNCNNNEVETSINVIPNTTNNGRTGCICGRYRRR